MNSEWSQDPFGSLLTGPAGGAITGTAAWSSKQVVSQNIQPPETGTKAGSRLNMQQGIIIMCEL